MATRSTRSWTLLGAALLVAVLAAEVRAAPGHPAANYHRHQAADQVVDVDVQVAGQSAAQLNASRYDVQDADNKQIYEDAVEDAPEVSLPDLGALRGTVSQTAQKKRTIYQFLGVPFAEPPVNEYRFKAPAPKKPWDNVWDATKQGKACIQTDTSALLDRRRRRAVAKEDQSEDCLFLDVHTPMVDRNAKLPVLVFVHGGSFLTGSSGIKTPYGLLDDDLVLVSPQYRLGPLGFLNLQTDDVPGNAGLLDLVEALRWVNKNIEYFGGDPNRVTLGGHSAGAASASLLYLSPLTAGLIHAVMPMSGSALAFWSYDQEPEVASQQIAVMAGCTLPSNVSACLRSKQPSEIVLAYGIVAIQSLIGGSLGMSGTTPSVQRAAGAVKVLPDSPEDILASANLTALPYLTGVTKHEGTFPLEIAETGYLNPNSLTSNSSFLRYDLIPVLLRVVGSDDASGFLADSVLQAFMDPDTLGNYAAMRNGLIDMVGAFGFKSPARKIVQRNSELLGNQTYLFAFNHDGATTQNTPEGVSHGADQPYLFPDTDVETLSGDDLKVALVLRKLVANFVIYHDPTPAEVPVTEAPGALSWPPFARNSEDYLEVVWPPSTRRWFGRQMTVARTEHFGETETSTWSGAATPPESDKVTPTNSAGRLGSLAWTLTVAVLLVGVVHLRQHPQ